MRRNRGFGFPSQDESMIAPDWQKLVATAIGVFLLDFPSLFAIINPIGAALIFDGVAKSFARAERMKLAARVAGYSLMIMFGALWGGPYVLNFFGVSLDALRIAGGTVVTLSAWQLLTSGEPSVDRKSREKPLTAKAARGDPLQLAFFPLTLPFTTGPGTIAVAIALGAERPASGAGLLAFFIGASLAILANAAIIWIAYRFSDRVTGLMGAASRLVIARLSAFLLMCIGVQILVSAVGDLVAKWRVT
jgi:multiple antibiotic resistance protein